MFPLPLVELQVANIYHWVLQKIFSLNQGIEFSPLIASWLFVIASFNFAFPEVTRWILNVQRLKTVSTLLVRGTIPYLLYRIIWLPSNRLLHLVLVYHLQLPFKTYCNWLPFLSIVWSIIYFILSLIFITWTSGPYIGLHEDMQKSLHLSLVSADSTGSRHVFEFRRDKYNHGLRMLSKTRSGRIYNRAS